MVELATSAVIYEPYDLEIRPLKVDFIGSNDMVIRDLMVSPKDPNLTMFTVEDSDGDDGVRAAANNISDTVNVVVRDMFVRECPLIIYTIHCVSCH